MADRRTDVANYLIGAKAFGARAKMKLFGWGVGAGVVSAWLLDWIF